MKDELDKEYDKNTGLPLNEDYLEVGLTPILKSSIQNMIKSWEILDSGKEDLQWDLNWCELNANINTAEADRLITSDEAWYLRKKYLRLDKEEII